MQDCCIINRRPEYTRVYIQYAFVYFVCYEEKSANYHRHVYAKKILIRRSVDDIK